MNAKYNQTSILAFVKSCPTDGGHHTDTPF
jgi:hypothetical protein